MATSPAQQAFRDYVKEINQMTRIIKAAIKAGEFYTFDIVYSFYREIELDWIEYFESENFNMELWQGRIESYAALEASEVADRYNLPDSIPDEEPPEPGEGLPIDEIFGRPVITEGGCITAGGRVRGQILLTLEELAEYIAPIPDSVIIGIVVIKNAKGVVEGYSICGSSKSR